MRSIGQQLSSAREARGLTIEDVTFHTRIPAGRVRDMENDDLSRFANLTYARGFLKIYSRFVELDISDYLDQFSSAEFASASGHEYIQTANATHNLPASVITDYGENRRPGLYILVTVLLLAGGIIWWNRSGPSDDHTPEPSSQPVPSAPPAPRPSSPPPESPKAAEPLPEPPPPKAEAAEEEPVPVV